MIGNKKELTSKQKRLLNKFSKLAVKVEKELGYTYTLEILYSLGKYLYPNKNDWKENMIQLIKLSGNK